MRKKQLNYRPNSPIWLMYKEIIEVAQKHLTQAKRPRVHISDQSCFSCEG